MEILTEQQKLQLTSIPNMKRWNEFKNYEYHQALWERFWKRNYGGRPEDVILDFGCGPCWGSYVGNALGYHDITNLDIDCEEVRTSFKHYTDILGTRVAYWDGHAMPFEKNRFDAVVAKASILKLVGTNFQELVMELVRVTKTGGTWYIAAIYMCRDFVYQLDRTDLMDLVLEKHIRILEWTWLSGEKRKLLIRSMFSPVRRLVGKRTG